MAVLRQIWLYGGIGGTLLMCQNSTMRVNGAWIKRYCISCSKTYNTSHSCHNFPAGLRQAARGARICETSLLWHIVAETKWPLPFCRHSQINYFYEKICIFIQISLKLVSKSLIITNSALCTGLNNFWLVTCSVPSHYLNQWWSNSMMLYVPLSPNELIYLRLVMDIHVNRPVSQQFFP